MAETGLLVVERVDWRLSPPAGTRSDDALARSVLPFEEVLHRYRGIDGIAWPNAAEICLPRLIDGLAPMEVFDDVSKYGKHLLSICKLDIILCRRIRSIDDDSLPEARFEVCGYDVGHWLDEFVVGGFTYSSLFHEVLFGTIEGLRSWVTRLNSALLFEDILSAYEYKDQRCRLSRRGLDLEEGEMEIIEVQTLRKM